MQYAPVIGRVLFSAAFIMFGVNHIMDPGAMTPMVPAFLPAKTAVVILTGIISIAGGVSVLIGYKAKLGALILFFFVLSTAVLVWGGQFLDGDPIGTPMFFKDLSMAGAALLIHHFGAGPMSLDAKSESSEEQKA